MNVKFIKFFILELRQAEIPHCPATIENIIKLVRDMSEKEYIDVAVLPLYKDFR
jgi:hypothetical protein